MIENNSLRREEADKLLPFFRDAWEPLREVLDRAGNPKSASQMVSRARDLEDRGLVESRWQNSMKVWRRSANQDALLQRVADAIRTRFYELVDQPMPSGGDAMLEVARAAIEAYRA